MPPPQPIDVRNAPSEVRTQINRIVAIYRRAAIEANISLERALVDPTDEFKRRLGQLMVAAGFYVSRNTYAGGGIGPGGIPVSINYQANDEPDLYTREQNGSGGFSVQLGDSDSNIQVAPDRVSVAYELNDLDIRNNRRSFDGNIALIVGFSYPINGTPLSPEATITLSTEINGSVPFRGVDLGGQIGHQVVFGRLDTVEQYRDEVIQQFRTDDPNATQAVLNARADQFLADMRIQLATSSAQGTGRLSIQDDLLLRRGRQLQSTRGNDLTPFEIERGRFENVGGNGLTYGTAERTTYYDPTRDEIWVIRKGTYPIPTPAGVRLSPNETFDVYRYGTNGFDTTRAFSFFSGPTDSGFVVDENAAARLNLAVGVPISASDLENAIIDYITQSGSPFIADSVRFRQRVPSWNPSGEGNFDLRSGVYFPDADQNRSFTYYNRISETEVILGGVVQYNNGNRFFYNNRAELIRGADTETRNDDEWVSRSNREYLLYAGQTSIRLIFDLVGDLAARVTLNYDSQTGEGLLEKTGEPGVRFRVLSDEGAPNRRVQIRNTTTSQWEDATPNTARPILETVLPAERLIEGGSRAAAVAGNTTTTRSSNGSLLDTSSVNAGHLQDVTEMDRAFTRLAGVQSEIKEESVGLVVTGGAPIINRRFDQDIGDLIDGLIDRTRSVDPAARLFGNYDEELELNVAIATRKTNVDANGNVVSEDRVVRIQNDLGLNENTRPLRDSSGAVILGNDNKPIVAVRLSGKNNTVRTFVEGPLKGITRFELPGAPLGVDFGDAGAILGNILGKQIAGDNKLARAATSATLKTVLRSLGEVIDGTAIGASGDEFKKVTASFGKELQRNLTTKFAGTVSSIIVKELVEAVGLKGFVGDLVNTAATEFLTSSILKHVFGDITQNISFNVVSAIGSFIGSTLASKVITFKSIGGQIGAKIGETLGSIFIGGFIGSFVGNIVGGLIGSIFGGTPRSGADVSWSDSKQGFEVSGVYSRKGGSKDAAKTVASAVADTLNFVMDSVGGDVADPTKIKSGNYGMRYDYFVYRPTATRDKDAITARFKGKDAVDQIIDYGLREAVSDSNFRINGGDPLMKRAIAASVAQATSAEDFQSNLIGNLAVAESYRNYLNNAPLINFIIGETEQGRESVFAAEVALTLVRAQELGLDRRHESDWYGGFTYLLSATQSLASDVLFSFRLSPSSYNLVRVIDIGAGPFNPRDQIDHDGQNWITADSGANIIDLRTGQLADRRPFRTDGQSNADVAVASEDFIASNQVVSFAVGERRRAISVGLVTGNPGEQNEQFLAELTAPSAVRVAGGKARAQIVENSADKPVLLVGRSFAYEADGYAIFRVSLSKAAATALSLDLTVQGIDAELGVDFGASLQVSGDGSSGWTNATSYALAMGQTEFFVRVAVTSDNVANPGYIAPIEERFPGEISDNISNAPTLNEEGEERFRLVATLTSSPSALAGDQATAAGIGTILDGAGNEPLVWVDNIVADEASGQAVFNLMRSSTAVTGSVNFSTLDRKSLQIEVSATVDGGAGDDTIFASNLGDNIFGGEGNDTLYGGRLDDWLLGGDGNDTLDAGTLDAASLGGDGNYLDGGVGNDILRGREGSDWLEGGDGTDTLTGGSGDDILAAGAGAGDSSKGGMGDDQYLVRLGDGEDTAEDEATGAPVDTGAGDAITQRYAAIAAGTVKKNWAGGSTAIQQQKLAGGEDAIVFGYGITMGDIQLVRSTAVGGGAGNDLVIRIMQTDPETGIEAYSGTSLTVKDWFTDPFKRIEWLKFADGNEIRIGDITSFIIGGEGNDVLVGTQGNDFVYGGAGDDILQLLGGDDIGNGGTGNDFVSGDEGRDLVIGGLGIDKLLGGAGSDAISGDDGADDIYGGADRDILSGGRGDGDQVVGGAGDDTFKYTRGDGKDTIFDEFSANWDAIWVNGTWSAGYTVDPVTGEVMGPDGQYIYKNFGTELEPQYEWLGRYDYDSVTSTLRLFDAVNATTTVANSGVDTLEFAPGINLQDVILRRVGNDLVMAISNDEYEVADSSKVADSVTIKDWYTLPGGIEKLAFYETGILDISNGVTNVIAGTDGADGTTTTPLAGTTLADWMSLGAGDDVAAGGTGKDIISGNSGSDILRGEADDDVLYGGTGNDSLDGGAGKDILVGGNGIDTASYASSTGATRIRLSFQSNNTANALGDEFYSIENVTGGSAADNIGGDAYENELDGAGGADTLMGGAADDTYIWNTTSGADTIREGAFVVEEVITTTGTLAAGYTTTWTNTGTVSAANKFYWRLEVRGPGNELVYEYALYSYGANTAMPAPTAWNVAGWKPGFAKTNGNQVTRDKFDTAVSGGDADTIEFGSGISLSDLTFIRAAAGVANATGPDLIVRYNNAATTQITIANHFTTYGGIETLQFRDGLSVSLASVLSASSTAALNGTANDDLIVGQTGTLNDLLYGGDGNDALSGLAGVDQLYGEAGDDVLEGGAGADRLDGGTNAVDGKGDTVRYIKSAAVTIDLQKTTAQAGGDAAGDTLFGIENVVGSQTGNDNITGDANANRIDALDGNNTINGKAGDDVLISGAGTDTIYGDLGDDNISSGDGNDILWGGDGNDVLFAGVGNDQLRGEAGDDQLLGGEGDDSILDGGIGNDEIYGDAGNDTLIGGDGNDTLGGGTGSDSLSGGIGDDIYFVQSNDGSDTIVDADGTNIISFDSGITHDRIWLTQAGSDLKIGVIGENTLLTVTNFFASSTPSRIKSIQTTTHAIFLDHPDVLNLISAMTAASTTVPTALPQAIADVQGRYWHQGGKAKPIAPAAARAVATNEDTAIAIDGNYGVIDHDSNVNGYQLKADAAPSKGVITNFNAATGAFSYTPNANVNGTDQFVVIVTDADGNATELPVTVTIASVNDAPTGIAVKNGGTLSVVESTPSTILAVGTIIGELEAIDSEGDAFTFTLVNDAGGRFTLSADGKLSIADPASINFEAAPSHIVRVRVTDALGASSEQDLVVAVQNGNEGNSIPASYSMDVAENSAIGTIVGNISASDIDTSGDFASQRYYFWDGTNATPTSSDGRYAINALNGQITVNAALDFEAPQPSNTYTVIARDNAGNVGFNQVQTSVTIGITDANDPNSLPASYSMTVNEEVAVGTIVGSVAATDADNAGSLFAQQRYYFWNGSVASAISSDGRYAIDQNTGQITTNAALNFEAGSTSGTYTVIARDDAGNIGSNQVQTSVTIAINNLNEANSLPASHTMAVDENVSVGTVVGNIAASDIDTSGAFGQQRYYFWDGTNATTTSADGRYAINAMNGEIRTVAALNFEAPEPARTYQVIARDNAGDAPFNQVQSSVTIGINDVNEAPVSLNWSPLVAGVAERDRIAAGGTRPAIDLGTLSVSDPDTAGFASANYVFSADDSRFEIVGNTLRLKQDASFDFEADANIVVTVTGTDMTGTPFTISQPITISVTDQDDILEGGAGNDTLTGQQGRDLIYANGGNDIVYGGEGHDVIEGGDGDDQLFGQGGVDRLLGGAGNDLLVGGDGDDYGIWHTGVADGGIWGGEGNDTIIGGAGLDFTFGEAGNDTFVVEEDGGTVWDRYDGGTGADTLSYSHFSQGGINVDIGNRPFVEEPAAAYFYGDVVTDVENVIATNFADTVIGNEGANEIYGLGGNDDLRGGLGGDYVDGGDGNDQLQGGDGGDTLVGGAGNDIIYGGAGNDTLRGGDGDDQLYAEAGDDLLDGGAGNDLLNGGIDNDTYIVTRSSGADTINNYDPSGDDVDVIGFQDSMGAINDSDLWFERIGNDLKISVIGTTSSVQVANWYMVTDPASRANHKIDFIIANTSYSRTINVEALVDLMATKTRPATIAERDVLMADLTYKANWATHWNSNAAPGLSAISNKATNEDSGVAFSVTATDDITPNAQVQLSAQVISGANVVSNAGISFGAADANGVRTMTINPLANASGTARIRVTAADAGGVTSTQEFDVVVAGVADTSTVTQFAGGAGNAAQPGGIPLTLNVSFPDQDGSETQEIWITGVPSGVTLSAGTYDVGTATWKLTPAQTANLKVNTPVGWSQDLALSVTARASENGQTAVSGAVATKVVVNTAPTGISVRGLGVNPALGIGEYTPSNNPAGRVVGTAVAVDPDALDNNILPSDLSQLPLGGWGEERIITATGPLGNQVQVIETGQDGYSGDHGGGLPWVNKGPADTSKAYKFTIYFKPENNAGHNIYWGTGGNLENAWDGQANGNPYFFYGNSSSFVQDRWYRVDGYILPTGTALIGNDVYGGVFDTVTGQKVADTFTYRFGAGGSDTIARFFSYYNQSNAAYSAQWYQPSIEKLEYSYSLVDSAGGRFAINAVTGLITSTGVNLDHEAATAHNITIRVTDALGLTRDQTVSVSVSNLNEANNMATSSTFYLDENRAAGAIVGTVSASDIDVGGAFADQRYYFWNGTTAQSTSFDGRFTINATTGVITTNASFNWEADPHTQHTVIARDNSGNAGYNQASTQVYIYLNNVNEQNSLPSNYSFNIEENQGIGSLLGTVAASDPDTSGAFGEQRYYFWDGSNASAFSWDGRYQINATSGQIASNQIFNFEDSSPSRSYTVIARDNQGSGGYTQSATTVNLNITNQNETPNAPGGGSTVWSFFDESGLGSNPAAPGAVVATFAMSDTDGSTPTLRLTSNPGGWFEIVGNQVRWAAGVSFNYETLRDQGYSTYDWNGDGRIEAHIANVYVDAFDGQYDSADTLLQVFISNVNEAPSTPTGSWGNYFTETGLGANPANAYAVAATFSQFDVDGTTPTMQFVAGGNPNNWFYISGNEVRFNPGLNFDFEWARNAGYTVYDWNGDGRLEAHVGTVSVQSTDGQYATSSASTHIFIEDVNEQNNLPGSYSFTVNENLGAGTLVGTVAASDVDSSAYAFGQQRYYFWNGSSATSVSSDGRYAINSTTGEITTNAVLNFEAGSPSVAYTVIARDNAGNAGYNQTVSTVTIGINDVNEAHSLSAASFTVNESNNALGPLVPVVNSANGVINLRDSMLSDPEGRNMRWQFDNSSTVNGAWQIEQDGTLRMVQGRDYEEITRVYEWQDQWDYSDPYNPIYLGQAYVWNGAYNAALATQTLNVRAIDDSTGHISTAALTLTVADINEAPIVYSYASYNGSGGGYVLAQSTNEYWVTKDKNGGYIVQLSGADPEGQSVTYSIINAQAPIERIGYYGGNDEIDATAYPYVYLDASNRINFFTPGEGNGDWEGGVKIGGTRRTSSVELNFMIRATDASGNFTDSPFKIIFTRRDTNAPPIVFDLDGDGLELVPYETSSVEFDMDGDDIGDETGWVAADDGLLALDRNNNGTIDNIAEISFVSDAEGALSDLEGLRAYDSDQDGYLDADDTDYGRFLIWRDANQDGVSQADELKSLADWGITAVNLSLTLTGQQPGQGGNVIFGTTEYEKSDGTSGTVGDVYLAYSPSNIDTLATPVVLDFDGDNAGLIKVANSNVRFDMDGNGTLDKTGWIEAGDAFLALDRNENGAIDNIREISFVEDKEGATTDLEGLRAFDSNGDGILSADDERFAEFKLWFDSNSNGVTDAGELQSLAEAGITSIDLTGTPADPADANVRPNIIYNRTSFTRADGSNGTAFDAGIAFERPGANGNTEIAYAGWSGELNPSTDAAASNPLPKIAMETRGYDKKAKRYLLDIRDGGIYVNDPKAKGTVDPRAGVVSGAAILSFKNLHIGMLSPVILDLDGDGLDIKSRKKSKAMFDMDGDGRADDTGWVGNGDGMLVIDRNSDGRITGASEISFLTEKPDAKSDLEALAVLDSNKDGKLDAKDTRFGELKVWIDANENGISDEGELQTLAEQGITEISLAGRANAQKVKVGQNAVIATTTFKRTDGSIGTAGDVALAFDPSSKRPSLADNQLSALRRGLDGGFEGFDSLQRFPEELSLQGAEQLPSGVADLRLAQMIQSMAVFGAGSGEGDLAQRYRKDLQTFDFNAMS